MFGKKKAKPQIDLEQLALIENAQRRVKQKKRLYFHFVFFLIGSVLLIVANTVLGIGKDIKIIELDWFVVPIIIWFILFLYHTITVFVTNKFMGKEWEQQQMDKLVAKQQNKIEALSNTLEKADKKLLKASRNLTMIVAAGQGNEIGKDNDLIWHLSDDLKHFKKLTAGHHIIMGRKTFESFPKPLPNRTHIVITRQKDYKVPEGVLVVNSIEEAIDAAKTDTQPYIIGGGEIYKLGLKFATKIEITRVHAAFDADTFFPNIDNTIWKQTSRIEHDKDEKHKHAFTFITYTKR